MSESMITDKQLALQRVAGNQQLAEELLQMLLQSLPQYQDCLQIYDKLLAAPDCSDSSLQTLKDQVHKLHGALQYCATPVLQHLIQHLDNQFKTLDNKQKQQLVQKILQAIEELLKQGQYL